MVETTCPLCDRVWTPTMFDDVLRPACGCYGDTIGPDTPCEACGLAHAWTCPKIPGSERRIAAGSPKLIEITPAGAEIHRGLVQSPPAKGDAA